MNERNEHHEVRITIMDKPPSGNEMRRKWKDRFAYANLRRTWARSIHYSLRSSDRNWLESMCTLKKKMHVEIHVSHKKLYDKDNLFSGIKVIPDCLVRLKLLKDDSEEFCDLHVTQEKLNTVWTVITIREFSQATEG